MRADLDSRTYERAVVAVELPDRGERMSFTGPAEGATAFDARTMEMAVIAADSGFAAAALAAFMLHGFRVAHDSQGRENR